jgi:NDP-sugar pyrophosphorylase family protein
MRVRYSRERTILGSAGGVRKVRPWLGDEPFLLLNGDMVFDFEIERLVARQRETGARACVSLQPHPASGRYGSVRTDRKGRVLSFGGHPAGARGEPWHFTGIHVMDPALLDRLRPGYAETARDLYGPLIAEGGLVVGVHLRGPWYDLSSPQLYLASQVALLDKGFVAAPRRRLVAGDARVDPRARLSRSVVGQGARIGPGARVSESVLWDGARVEAGARVERAVVGSGARVPAGALARDLVLLRRTRATEGLPGIRDGQHWIEVKA